MEAPRANNIRRIDGLNVPQQHLDVKLKPMVRPLTPNLQKNVHPCLCPDVDTGARRRIRSFNGDADVTANIPTILATNKMPPNWKKNYNQTVKNQATYGTYKTPDNSAEYAAICSLLHPLHVVSVEQIVNPTLWHKFEQKRKEMIKSKSSDVATLSSIGVLKKEMKIVLQYAKDFQLHPDVASVPYNDNMNLLFHCTRNKSNIEGILRTGLDERIGNGGLLGRGIYFADNPRKSMAYDGCGTIFIFGVLLGDCLSFNNVKEQHFVREPEKYPKQKRNHNDLNFDSITGRPMDDNEYVIYDRNQAIPLYMVKYDRLVPDGPSALGARDYVAARKLYPPFCWSNDNGPVSMPSLKRLTSIDWPFYSNKVFDKMGVLK